MEEEVQRTVEVLKNGGTILYPTDTVWGIGCDATNEEAVDKVLDIKGDRSNRLIILLAEDYELNRYVRDVPEMAWQLLEVTEDPLTLIYPEAINLAENVPAEDGSIGIRIVQDEFCKAVIKKLRKPLVSTSANKSGEPTPMNFDSIDEAIQEEVDHVVDWRREERENPKPSSVIRIGLGGEIEILRE